MSGWKERVAQRDETSILGKLSQREQTLVEDHTLYSQQAQQADHEFVYIQEGEHCKRRRVMSRWRWACEMSGNDDTAKAAALMKALYAEDHNQALGFIEDELELHRDTTKDGLAEIANQVDLIDPSNGRTDMVGVEASLDALNDTLWKAQK